MTKFISPRIQRILGMVFLVLFQITVLGVAIYGFSNYFVYLYALFVTISLVVSLVIANNRSRLAYKIAWIIPILIFPLFGGLAYLLLGGARRPSKTHIYRNEAVLRRELVPCRRPEELLDYGTGAMQQARYLQNTALCPLYDGTRTQYFPSGETFFPTLLEKLSQAEHYILLEYFIISEGEMWNRILDILVEKVAAGVEVRVIYDGLGSVVTLPSDYDKELERLGIYCVVFRPVRPVLSIHQNNRDHRKICVIDGIYGFAGGLNLSDEYINLKHKYGYWKDSAILLEGKATWSLAVMFLHMWEEIQGEKINYTNYRPRTMPEITASGFIQPYMDTPLPTDTVCADLHLQMFTKAKWYLYITTPYLVIDETMASALCVAAQTGVDVRLITPHIPDKKTVFQVTQSYYETLILAGVRIYEFLPGFIHSKTVVVDDRYASVGSCNLDYRSLYLQYENGVWLCGDPAVLSVREDFLSSLSFCQEVTLEQCRDISFWKRLLRSVLRLFSPLL